jgi:hypothetical protein
MATPSDYERFVQWLVDINYPAYYFTIKLDSRGSLYLQGWYEEADIFSGAVVPQYTRRWLLSPHMSKSEFVQTVFKLVLTSSEHRVREHFKYMGMRVYSPHHDVDALHKMCMENPDARRES